MTDQAKLSDFIREEYHNLVSYVSSYWNSYRETEAEDIVQDVAATISAKLDINTPIENLAAYFYRSLKNRIIDKSRKRQDLRLSEMEQAESYAAMEQSSAEDQDHKEDKELQLKMIYQAMEYLKPAHREIIYLTEFDGYTYEELSEEMEIPIGTLLSRKHRAMAQLQLIINKNNNHGNN